MWTLKYFSYSEVSVVNHVTIDDTILNKEFLFTVNHAFFLGTTGDGKTSERYSDRESIPRTTLIQRFQNSAIYRDCTVHLFYTVNKFHLNRNETFQLNTMKLR
nr:PREDICTED: uncharacterized protein LOC105661855 [Megachile rotundata]